MAQLTYRSPLEEGVSFYETSVQSAIASTSALYYTNSEKENFQFFSFHLKAEAKKKLSTAGLYLSPFSYRPHSHPVCKTLENYMLYTVLPSYLDSTFMCVGIKNQKIELLKSRDPRLNMMQLVNRYVSSLDKSRYGSDFVKSYSSNIPGLRRHARGLNGVTLKGLVPEFQQRNAKKLFFHDELHYWSLQDLSVFLEVYKPETCLATVVYPPELLARSKRSLYPWCYQYEIVGDDLLFFPDGVRSEGYVQPLRGGYLLDTSKILLPDGDVYCVDILCSKFAHHLIAITRGDMVVPKIRSFGPFDATGVRDLGILSGNNVDVCFPVSFEVVSKMYRYLRSLKKPDEQSAMAKLSQIVPEPTGAEIKFVQDFSRLVMDVKSVRTTLLPEHMTMFLGKWLSRLPPVIASRFSSVQSMALDSFVENLEPFVFKCKTVIRQSREEVLSELLDLPEVEMEYDLPSKLEAFSVGQTVACPSRVPAPYASHLSLVTRRLAVMLTPSNFLDDFIVREYTKSNLNASVRRFSAQSLRIFVSAIFKKATKSGLTILVLNQLVRKHYLSESKLDALRSRIVYKCGRLAKWYFWEVGIAWFYCNNAVNQNYLTANEEVTKMPKSFSVPWMDVLQGIGAGKQRLRKTRYRYVCMKNAPSIPIIKRSGPVADITSEQCCGGSVREEFEQVSAVDRGIPLEIRPGTSTSNASSALNLICACGCCMPIKSLNTGALHGFVAPDTLRNRSAGWYSMNGLPYRYNGGAHESLGWPTWLIEWIDLNGFSSFGYDCCLYQVYLEGAGIGYHSDDENIFELGGPILTVNLSGSAEFWVSCRQGDGTVTLCGSQHFTMPEGFQESHKHSVRGCSAGRESVTFRKMSLSQSEVKMINSSVVSASGDVEEVEGDVTLNVGANQEEQTEYNTGEVTVGLGPVSLAANLVEIDHFALDDGLWSVLSKLLGYEAGLLGRNFISDKPYYLNGCGAVVETVVGAARLDHSVVEILLYVSCKFSATLNIIVEGSSEVCRFNHSSARQIHYLKFTSDGYFILEIKDFCVPRAISLAIKRGIPEVHAAIKAYCSEEVLNNLEGKGTVPLDVLPEIFRAFDIQARVVHDGVVSLWNPDGRLKAEFSLTKEHLEYLSKGSGLVTHSALNPFEPSFRPSEESLTLIGIACTKLTYVVAEERAMALVNSLHIGATGVLCSEIFNGKKPLITEWRSDLAKTAEVFGLFGTFGAGKSTLLSRLFKLNQNRHVWYVSPRKALAEEFKAKIGLGAVKGHKNASGEQKIGQARWKVQTFEILLLNLDKIPAEALLILDEVQLYPPGYLDLLIAVAPAGVTFLVGGDPCQSDYDNERDRSLLSHLNSDLLKLLGQSSYKFNKKSKRFMNPDFVGRLPCDITLDGRSGAESEDFLLLDGIESLRQVPDNYLEVILVSSFDEKKIVEFYSSGFKRVATFGESTGQNFSRGTILITDVSKSTSEQRWITALSRFSRNICFVNASSDSMKYLGQSYKGRCLGNFLCKTANIGFLESMLPGNVIFTDEFVGEIGKDEGLREEKLAGDPWLKTMIGLAQNEDAEEIEMLSEIVQEEWFKVHLPQQALEAVRARWVHKFMAKEDREVRMGDMTSNQFTDDYSKQLGKQLTNAAERFEAIYPRHRANDTVTFIMAVKKRLRFSNPAKEKAKLAQAKMYGGYLLQEFLKKVPLKKQHDAVMMEKALQAFEDKKVSKSAATIENHSERSCSDWLADVGLIFSKSQLCTKFDNRFRVAKAAQSIVCFQHAVLCRFAPFMRYIEMKVHEALPNNFYIHSGKGLEELDAWVQKGGFDDVCTESDYEAFDASQDQYIMAFELAIMDYLGLPKDLINDYIYIKTHLGSKLGNFAIMRFSGEASTFLFNTMANMLFTFQRYELRGNEFICFAGDDMCASKHLTLSAKHESFLGKLKLKAKVQFTKSPTFCGWNLIPEGIYKKPQLVLERMCIAKETNNLHNCIDNYAIEVSFAYKLGEKAVCRMSEEEVEALYNCVRIIVKNKHLLKSNVISHFSNLE
uniref:Replicase polyprotein n=1 Tax=Soybean carlavirus 1 TaxID=2796532 RepID=A0A8B0MWU0_9VIRU|nr:replicase polyprotein [Soybean carlavirus 1]